jgi:hypothetical protein
VTSCTHARAHTYPVRACAATGRVAPINAYLTRSF